MQEGARYPAGFRQGFRANFPVAASAMAYGSVLGVLAAPKGVSWLDMVFMNTAVFAGSAQFVMVDMWAPTLPVFEMALAAIVINLRYLLIGASLEPIFAGRSLLYKMVLIHPVADENWAITMAEARRNPVTPWFLFGGGVCCYLAWSAGTVAGVLGGAAISHPEAYALDFAFTAVFTALAVGLWRGKTDVLPWLVAGVVAWGVERVLPGKWYIVAGGLSGALAAAFGPAQKPSEPASAREGGCDADA